MLPCVTPPAILRRHCRYPPIIPTTLPRWTAPQGQSAATSSGLLWNIRFTSVKVNDRGQGSGQPTRACALSRGRCEPAI